MDANVTRIEGSPRKPLRTLWLDGESRGAGRTRTIRGLAEDSQLWWRLAESY
jgi:hypothetical protein